MIIDRSGLKRMALWAGLILFVLLGTYYVFGGNGSQARESKVKNKPVIATQSPTAETSGSSFCARYRMEREQVRSQEVNLLNQVVDKGGSQGEASSNALQRLVRISSDIDSEMKMENLVRCHGARDCVAMVEPDNTTVIIASRPMDKEEIAEIKSELCKILDCETDRISLIFRDH